MVQTKSPPWTPLTKLKLGLKAVKKALGILWQKLCRCWKFYYTAPVQLWTLFHLLLLTLLVFNVGPDSPLKCTFGSLGVYGMQGGWVLQSQKIFLLLLEYIWSNVLHIRWMVQVHWQDSTSSQILKNHVASKQRFQPLPITSQGWLRIH